MDEERLAGLELAAFDERDVGSNIGADRGREARPSSGDGVEIARGADGVVGEGAGLGAVGDARAGLQAYAFARGVDHAGQVHADGEGRVGFELVFALEHQEVGEVEAGGLDAIADFAGAGFRRRQVLQGDAGEILR